MRTDKDLRHLPLISLVVLVIATGVFLGTRARYGGDPDTYEMLRSWLSLVEPGPYTPSRFTGSPAGELVIGFLSWWGGSQLANIAGFVAFLVSLPLFLLAMKPTTQLPRVIVFLALSITNVTLFFDNLVAMDYAWALLAYSIGLFFVARRWDVLGVVALGVSVGFRISFLPFVLIAAILFRPQISFSRTSRFSLAVGATLVGGMFYLPVWFTSDLGLGWLSSAGPDGGLVAHLGRLVFKSWSAVGMVAALVVLVIVVRGWTQVRALDNYTFLVWLIGSNLVLFLYLPAEPSYLQPALVALMALCALVASSTQIVILLSANLLAWLVQPNLLSISYQNDSICEARIASEARFQPSLNRGRVFTFLDEARFADCISSTFGERRLQIEQGLSLR